MTAETFFQLFNQYGLILVCAVVFCEYMNLPGFPAGVIMPCVGVLIARSELSLPLTVFLSVVAGVLGSLVIYAVCYWGGEPVMEKLRLYTQCGPAHRLSLQVILFYQVDIILSHPAVNLNVSAALQNTFSDLTNFFFVFLAGTLYFLCTLSVSISLLYCIFSSILRKPNFIPQSGRRNFSKCCTPKTKNAASRSWSSSLCWSFWRSSRRCSFRH